MSQAQCPCLKLQCHLLRLRIPLIGQVHIQLTGFHKVTRMIRMLSHHIHQGHLGMRTSLVLHELGSITLRYTLIPSKDPWHKCPEIHMRMHLPLQGLTTSHMILSPSPLSPLVTNDPSASQVLSIVHFLSPTLELLEPHVHMTIMDKLQTHLLTLIHSRLPLLAP